MPCGVATRTSRSMSSMLPYLERFMPLARVAIQPPRVESSMESGSMPMVTPLLARTSFRADPVIPASRCAAPSSGLTHSRRLSPRMSSATKGRGSSRCEGHAVAEVTFVLPPTGTTAKPPASPSPAAAACRTASTSSSLSGRTTASGMRDTSRERRRQTSARPWPVPARSRASASLRTRASGSTATRRSKRPGAGGGTSGSGRSGSVSRTLRGARSSSRKSRQRPWEGRPAMAP
mmetsp:Transcript_108933/g.264831  ORF Transcript_108933/g.264831 Transcript_108933/m.264831 type:complete len:234 (+) Transcript_108933:503-1204(+)